MSEIELTVSTQRPIRRGDVIVSGTFCRRYRFVIEAVAKGWVKMAELKWTNVVGEMERNGLTVRLKLRDFGSRGMVPYSRKYGGAFDRIDTSVRVVAIQKQ